MKSSILPPGLLFCAAVMISPLPGQVPGQLEREMKRCADKVIPATVTILAGGMDSTYKKRRGRLDRSTGVILDPSGLVLSDSAATLKNEVYDRKTKKTTRTYGQTATVFLSPYRNDPARSFPAKLIMRDEKADVSLLQIELPSRGIRLPYIKVGNPKDFKPGSYLMIAGNSFGTARDGKPSMSVGVFSGWLADKDHQGRFMTNAAVNPGSNGGPVVDLGGNLQGIVSTYGRSPEDTHYGMGLITHLGVMAEAFKGVPAGKKLFHVTPKAWRLPKTAHAYRDGYNYLMKKCRFPVVGISIDRGDTKNVITYPVRTRQGVRRVNFKRCDGPYTGLCIDPEGYIVTSLRCLWKSETIESIKVFCDDGRVFDAELMARDFLRGIGLLMVITDGEPLPTLPHAKGELFPGATALALARPWNGTDVKGNSLIMTNGVISALHQGNMAMDAIQFDAGLNDSMVGGALINLKGELVGMNQLIDPDKTGRNSGIAYAIPIAKLLESVKTLKEGKDIQKGYIGISLAKDKEGMVKVAKVTKFYPAYEAGIKKDDELVSLAGRKVSDYPTIAALFNYLNASAVGDKIDLVLKRQGKKKKYTLTFGEKL